MYQTADMGGSRIVEWFRRWGTALIIAAAVVFAVVIGGYIYSEADRLTLFYKHQAAQKAEKYAERAREEAQTSCALLPPQYQPECVNQEVEAARPSQRDEYDLQAQLVTAAWTRAMGVAALIAMVAGIVGVALVFITFRETKKAAQSATNTYQAFVNVERGKVVISGEYPHSLAEQVMEAKATLSNIGRSSVVVTRSRYWANPGCDFPGDFPAEIRIDHALEPGHEGRFTIALFDITKVNEAPFLGGYVEYRTAFGSPHKAYFLLNLGSCEDGKAYIGFKDHPYIDRESRKRFGWPDDT